MASKTPKKIVGNDIVNDESNDEEKNEEIIENKQSPFEFYS